MNNKTINYYNKYTKSFIQTTRSVDFTNIQNKFLSYLPSGASILDFGCGSGRDTKYFLKRNYNVTAIDVSEEICKEASKYTGIKVKQIDRGMKYGIIHKDFKGQKNMWSEKQRKYQKNICSKLMLAILLLASVITLTACRSSNIKETTKQTDHKTKKVGTIGDNKARKSSGTKRS